MTFTPERSDAIRTGLIAHVAQRAPKRRRVLAGTGLVLAGALIGAGTATAVAPKWWQQFTRPDELRLDLPDPVDAPAGQLPGTMIVSVVGDPISLYVSTPTQVSLADRPAEATHANVTITCLAAGRFTGGFTWGTSADGNNMIDSCGPPERWANRTAGWTQYAFPLYASVGTLYIDPARYTELAVTVQYQVHTPTKFHVNGRGETYGVQTDDETPDLIAAMGTAPDGREVLGYVRASDMYAFSPDHPDQPTSPEQAVSWQQERDAKYPNGWTIPVYESDGVTQIGTQPVG